MNSAYFPPNLAKAPFWYKIPILSEAASYTSGAFGAVQSRTVESTTSGPISSYSITYVFLSPAAALAALKSSNKPSLKALSDAVPA